VESSAAFYTEGQYGELNAGWHAEDAAYKGAKVVEILDRAGLRPASVCEVGCGSGGVLAYLQEHVTHPARYSGWDIAPRALELARRHEGEAISFRLGDFLEEDQGEYELLLALDVVEHVENYLSFLRRLRERARWHVFHFPLDLNAEWMLRGWPLLRERRTVGHVNYFNKDLALASLEEAGFSVRDHFYTPWVFDLADRDPRKTIVRRSVTRVVWRLNQDLCARLLRGFSLMVLAER
jgi:SAM-dependent methyltransferase